MKKARNPNAIVGAGVGAGVAIGVAIGNIGSGVALGVGIGFALRSAAQRRLKVSDLSGHGGDAG